MTIINPFKRIVCLVGGLVVFGFCYHVSPGGDAGLVIGAVIAIMLLILAI